MSEQLLGQCGWPTHAVCSSQGAKPLKSLLSTYLLCARLTAPFRTHTSVKHGLYPQKTHGNLQNFFCRDSNQPSRCPWDRGFLTRVTFSLNIRKIHERPGWVSHSTNTTLSCTTVYFEKKHMHLVCGPSVWTHTQLLLTFCLRPLTTEAEQVT